MREMLAWASIGLGLGLCAGPAAAEADLSGHWEGRYRCSGQPEATMVLDFVESGAPVKEGVLAFDAAGVRGSYAVSGRVQGRAQFRIVARDWIDRPEGFAALGLNGRLDGDAMEGTLKGCRGGTFSAARDPVEGPPPPTVAERGPEGDATPPEAFGGAIGGALAAAPSAEAQCRVLADWYAPVVGPGVFEGLNSRRILEVIAPLFRDEAFAPVFGVPLELLDQNESRALGQFVRRTCHEKLGMERHRDVFVDVFRSPIYGRDIAAINERQDEAVAWEATTREELAAIRVAGPEALGRLRAVEGDIRRRSNRLPEATAEAMAAEVAALREELEAAAREEAAERLIARLDGAGNDLDQGHLGTALRVADEAGASDMTPEQVARVVEAARSKAETILTPRLTAAAALAGELPASLDGLRRARAALAPFDRYREGMDRTFGSIDPDGRLQPLYARLGALESDPAVLAEIAAALAAAAASDRPREAVEALSVEVAGADGTEAGPEIATLIAAARDEAEVNAVVVEDRSTSPDPAEPTAREIASFALQRVREVSAGMAEMDATCTSGQVSDPMLAIACLGNPALWTGQTGSGVTLLRVSKLGCEPEVAGTQYLCSFVQDARIEIAGGAAFGADRWGDLSQQLSGGEAVDARFIRAAGGGWNVIWGDLR